jgi:two-component system cell cycle sensor histidine kinase/response regulator CckA
VDLRTDVNGATQQCHHGDLSGIGSAFVTEIVGEPLPSAALAVAVPWNGPKTILLVEDELFVRQATAAALESAGYRLLVAGSGAEGLDLCRKCRHPVDLLLTDVVMPGMSGRQLAKEFEGLCPHARVLLMSGHAEQLARSELTGADRKCLVKPFSARILLGRVRELLDRNELS